MAERVTVGDQKVSVTVTRKTAGDLLVSQHSAERWFEDDKDAARALRQIIEAFIEPPSNGGSSRPV